MKKQYDKYKGISQAKTARLLESKPVSMTHDALREELLSVEKDIKRLQIALEQPADGKLLVSGTVLAPKYYLRDKSGKHYLPGAEMERVADYAQKEYYADLLKVLRRRYSALSEALHRLEKADPEKVFQNMSENRKRLVVPEFLPDNEFVKLWSSARYGGKGFREDMPEHYTAKGERVRSKSEGDIADRCYYRGVYYRYEYPWTLSTAGVWFPDFTVVNVRTRKVYIWEHFGMEDDPNYAINALRKLRIYQQNGIWPGEQLIITHETYDKPLNIRDIDAIIDHYLV